MPRRIRKSSGAIISAFLFCAMLTACFTGIESTPRISDKELKSRNAAAPTQEQIIGQSLTFNMPFAKWSRGRKFLVTDDRAALLFSGDNKIVKSDTLSYEGLTTNISFIGDTLVNLNFRKTDGLIVCYPTGQNLDNLWRRDELNIPFTVDLNSVATADSILRGRELYLLTTQRVDSLGDETSGRRFIKVKIAKIQPGDDVSPLIVSFTTPEGEIERVKMTLGNERRAIRNFHTLFSIADPRLKYPAISDEMWQNIINGRLVEGMTRDEARLAAGTPNDVKKAQNGAVYVEQWTYNSGRYLIFEDGLLVRFRY